LPALAAAAPAARAEASGRTALGGAYVSGGIGEGEIAALDAQRDRYSLWVITAAKVSGAYLADVRVRIVDAKKALVFDHTLAGPWLLVDLPLGRYDVEASYQGQTMTRPTAIHAGDRHQIVFYFDVPADVLPKETAKK
jgi:hypothetical protein